MTEPDIGERMDLSSDKETSRSMKRVARMVGEVVVTTAIMQGVAFVYSLLFSTRFFGGDVMRALRMPSYVAQMSLAAAAAVVVASYLLDFSYWPSVQAQRGAIGLLKLCFVVYAVTAGSSEPSLPIGLFILGMPLLGLALAKHVLRCFPTAHALLTLAVNFFVTSLTLLGSYPFFYMGDTFFSIDNQRLWLTDVGCTDVGFVKSLAASTCTEAAFLMWISPAVLSVVCLVYAVVLVLLSLSIKNISPWAIARVAVAIRKESAVDRLHGTIMGALTQARQKESQKTVLVAAKALTAAMMFVMVAVYVAAALAPAGTKLSHAVISLCFMALLAIGLVLVSMFGAATWSKWPSWRGHSWPPRTRQTASEGLGLPFALVRRGPASQTPPRGRDPGTRPCQTHRFRGVSFDHSGAEELSGAAMQQPLVRLTFSYMRTDNCVTQAVCVFVGTPLFVLYLALAAANQAVRRLGKANGWSFTKTLAPSDEGLALTRFASGHLAHVQGWPWASVLIMVNYLALAAWVLLYGSTLTYMGMAMLISWLKTMHWLVASLMFFAVGIVMFLLPPVPGLAVYLTAGILLTPVCEGPFGGEPYGFWIACLYAAFLAYASPRPLPFQVVMPLPVGAYAPPTPPLIAGT